MTAITETTWHGRNGWRLENEAVRVVILPELGAKIVSLFDKRAGHEWLAGPVRPLRKLSYGASFGDQDMSGWDEMFPTIDACEYPGPGPFAGRTLPDHGEVWSLPWKLESAGHGGLTLSVAGRALPYRLWRSASLLEPGMLKLDYKLENIGTTRFHYLWAAHPQFAADANTAILLPETVDRVVNVLEGDAWGEPGRQHPWPEAESLDGEIYRLDRIGPEARGDCRKFYLPPEHPVRWAALVDRRRGWGLRFEWHVEELPYLGVWVDEGAYNQVPVAALEPSTGYYDSLTRAISNQRAPSIAPGASQTWGLVVRLGIGFPGE